MKTATVRDLRNHFSRVSGWIEDGQTVEITKDGVPFAILSPRPPPPEAEFKMPDIMARLKEDWGDRIFTNEEVAAMRAAELEGEEG
jgi:antitoxin (DNA-binding transcriptional repressor) of toxin-antitoxin stability system